MSEFVNDPQNPLVDELRKRYLEEHNIDTSLISNERLIYKHGQDLEAAGYDMDGIASQAGELFKDQYYDIKNRPDPNRGLVSESVTGLKRGISGELGMGAAGLGLASGLTGLEGAESYLMGKASEFQADASANQATIERASDVRWSKPSEVVRFLAGAVGEVFPSMASSALSFGGGGLIGRQIVKKTIDNRIDKSVGDSVRDLSMEMAKAKARGFAVGSTVGTALNSLGLGTGEIYSELYQYSQLDKGDADYVDPDEARKLSLGFGVLSGSLDFASAGTLLSKLTGTPANSATSYLKRLILGLPEGVILEGSTEAAQQFVNMAASKYARGMELEFNDNELAQLFDAGVLGAVGGAQFAAVGAIKGPRKSTDDPTPIQTPQNQAEVKQKELLDYLQEKQAKEFRYQPGDRVDVAMQGPGELLRVLGDKAEVKLDDGTIKTVNASKLSAEIIPEVIEDEESNTNKVVTYKEDSDDEDSIKEIQSPFAELKGDQAVVVDVNGRDVTIPDLTVKEAQDVRELYDTLKDMSEKNLTRSHASSLKTKGVPPTKTAMKLALGDKYKRLWNDLNLQRLVNAGVLNGNREWMLGTKLDREYEAEQKKKIQDERLNYISLRDYIAPDQKVRYAGQEREIKEVTSEGLIKFKDTEGNVLTDPKGNEILALPTQVTPSRKRIRKPITKRTLKGPPKSEEEKQIQEDDEEDLGLLFDEDGKLPEGWDFKGKKIFLRGNTRKAEPIEATNLSEFTEKIREFINKKNRNGDLDAKRVQLIKDFNKYGRALRIDGKEYALNVEYSTYTDPKGKEKQFIKSINVGGLPLESPREVELKAKQSEINFTIDTFEFDEHDTDQYELGKRGQGKKEFWENTAETQTKTKAAVILKKMDVGYPYSTDNIRILKLYQGSAGQIKRVMKIVDGGKEHLLKNYVSKEGGYKVVGKIVATKKLPAEVDIFFKDESYLREDPEVKRADIPKEEFKKDTEESKEAISATKRLEDIEEELEELKGKTDEESRGRINLLNEEKKELTKRIKKKTGEGGDKEKKLKELQELIDKRDILEKVAREKRTPTDEEKKILGELETGDLKLLNARIDAFINVLTKKYEFGTKKGEFIEETGGQEDTAQAAMGVDKAKKEVVVDEVVATAGRGLARFQDIDPTGLGENKNGMTRLLFAGKNQYIEPFRQTLDLYIENKKQKALAEKKDKKDTPEYTQALVDFATKVYESMGGTALAWETTPLDEGIKVQQGERTTRDIKRFDELMQLKPDVVARIQRNLEEFFEFADQQGMLGATKDIKVQEDKIVNFIKEGKKILKSSDPYDSYQIIDKAFQAAGLTERDAYDKAQKYYEDPILDAGDYSLSDILDEITDGLNIDPDKVKDALYKIYDVEKDFENLDDNYPFLVEDLRQFINLNYQPNTFRESEDMLASKYTDPRSINRINQDEPHIPNKISPVTGKVDHRPVLVVDETTQEMSILAARDDEQSYMAPPENPLDAYPDLLEQGRAAMKKIAPAGVGVEFGMKTALNNIARLDLPQEIKNVALLLDNEILKDYKVEFMEWEQFRPYASPTKGVLNKAVALPRKKKIYISTAFNNSYKYSAQEMLAADIVHEALHAISKPALDLGYAYANGKQEVIEKMIQDHGLPTKFNMDGEALGKIWSNINDTLLPYLREQADLDNYYGLTSIDEFFSELASNPKFQDFLSKQQLPQSLKGRGLLRTALDYILSFLAKLGMRSASLNEDAMTYARNEMKKLINISNGTSVLHDSIESSNLRQINQLSSRLDTSDIIDSYDEILERFSREAPPESDASLIKDLANILQGSTRAEQEASERKRDEAEALNRYAEENGIQISRASFNARLEETEIFGGEHEVYFDETQMRFFKAPKLVYYNGTDYLNRLALHNSIFPESSYKVEGIMDGRPIVSQEAVIGEDPSQAQIDDHMATIGFEKLEGYNNPIYRKGDIDVWDVRQGNAYMVDGTLIIFDPQIGRVTQNELNQEKLAKAVTEDSVKQAMIEKLINETTDIDELIGIMDEMDNGGGPVLGNQFTSPTNDIQRPANARPDDNAYVMMQANAAGFNELVDELTKVHREIGEELGLDLKEFLDIYGKPKGKPLSKIRKILQKDMQAFDINPDDIRIEDAGLNKVARSFGVRRAVSNLERVREKARKNKQSSSIIIDQIENIKAKSQRIHEDLKQGKLPARTEIIDRFKKRLNNITFQKLEEYAKTLPNSGISQADLNSIGDLKESDISEIMDAVVEARGETEYAQKLDLIERIEGSSDPRFDPVKGDGRRQKLKRLAVAMTIRDSRDVLSLLRLSKGILGPLDGKYKSAAEKIAKAKDIAEIESVEIPQDDFPGVSGTPLKYYARMRKEEIKELERLKEEETQVRVYDLIDRSLGDRSARLRMALGELEPVGIHDGVTLVTLEKDSKGNWKRGTYEVKMKGGKIDDREGFIKANKNTLIGLRDEKVQAKYSNEPWWEIMREQAELALAEPILDEHFHAQRAAWFSGLQGLTERFNKLGYEGKKLAQMGTRTVALYRDYAGKSMAYSKQFNAAAHRVMSKLELSGNKFYTGIYQDIFWWMDNHPEYAGKEEEAFTNLWKWLKENANVPNKALLNDEVRRLTKDMINKAITARDWEAEVNRRLGNRVRDEDIKVESFVNQEMVDFYRLPLEMGFATMPRTLNNSYLRETYRAMNDQWGKNGKDLLAQSAAAQSDEDMKGIYSNLFSDTVVESFVKPYTNTDVRQSVFRGPEDDDGYNPELGNSFINKAFKITKGDVYEMSNYIYDELGGDAEGRLKWQHYFLTQWFKRYGHLNRVAGRVVKSEQGMHAGESMQNTPQSLDARMVESRLPKEFFYYNMYDEVSSNIRLALMTATASFGRNGNLANDAYLRGSENLKKEAAIFNEVMSKATGSDHDKPQSSYSKAAKREAYKELRRRGYKDAEKAWNHLRTQAVAVGTLRVVFNHLGKYYGKDNVSGPYQDANLLLELLGAQSMQVLNNPKSSFWQALALFEFPMAFRGLNRMAGKGTITALGNFANQTFGGMAEAMGMTLDRAGTYAEYLNDTHYRMDEMDLEFKEYNSMLGSGGDLAMSIRDKPGLGLKKYIRMVKNLSLHHRRKNKDGTRAPIDPLTPLTGIFPYINNVVNHSVGVGAIHVYNDLIIKVANEIEARGLEDFKEFTAQDLGMGNKTGEWIIGEEDGYKRANEILVAAGAPSISRLAFDYVDRKKNNENALPIEKNMALLINQVAMNNVAGEGFNSKPAWLYTSPAMRYFSTFLGWPLGKMGRDLQFIVRDSSDKVTTYKALLKYIGLLSAVYAPVGLSFAMLIDWYDEEMTEKPNNLPPISPWAALPVLGIPLAMRDENFSLYSITSRLAKAGVPMGMAPDILNGIFAKGDPYGSARELSLDSRIFAISMFKNIYDAIGTWVHAGEYDWQMIGRPIAYGIGGNSVIQMMDLTTALFDIDSEERRVADYIGMKNYIKKTAFMLGYELTPPYKGGGRQTPVSLNTRQMARAAYAGDTQDFLKNYQEALEAAKEQIERTGDSRTPEDVVMSSFKSRELRIGVTKKRMTDPEWELLLSMLPPDAREKIMFAMNNHEQYLSLIGGRRRAPTSSSTLQRREQARRDAMYYLSQ